MKIYAELMCQSAEVRGSLNGEVNPQFRVQQARIDHITYEKFCWQDKTECFYLFVRKLSQASMGAECLESASCV